MIIDAHTHVIPLEYLQELEARADVSSLRVSGVGSDRPLIETAGVTFALSPIWFDPDHMLEKMDRTGISAQVISPPTFLFHYGDAPIRALELARIINDSYAEIAAKHPGRFYAMGTVPLQDVDLACRELHRMAKDLSIRAVEIGTFVDGRALDSEELRPFFREAEKLGIFIFVHPLTQQQVGEQALEFAYLRNLVGLPTSTAFAIESIIFSDFLDTLPDLKIGFAHGGGTGAILLDRWDAAWQESPQEQERCARSPIEAFHSLYFDTVMHSVTSLELLLKYCDPAKLMLGSDSPADMGTLGILEKISATVAYRSGYADQINAETARSLFSGPLRFAG
jgi:aminocarboxymuconate-semialdehyde decarboxylase